MQFLVEYGLFLAKAVTWVVAILFVVASVVSIASKEKGKAKGKLKIEKLNAHFDEFKQNLQQHVLNKDELKQVEKAEKKQRKAEAKAAKSAETLAKKRLFLLDFHGDIKASAVQDLREEITALLTIATSDDEVVLRLESPGGVVHGYGLAASQLQRLKQANIPLTISIDKVAASGGYMMACVADKVLAAPFAILGSIGVIAQIPNVNRLLKKNHIDFEQITAGEFKRTLTVFGENSDKDRQKMQEEVEDTHELFKQFIHQNRPNLDLQQVATGEHWFGTRALELNLVDELTTSDDYLLAHSQTTDIYTVAFQHKKSLSEKLAKTAQLATDKIGLSWLQKAEEQRYL